MCKYTERRANMQLKMVNICQLEVRVEWKQESNSVFLVLWPSCVYSRSFTIYVWEFICLLRTYHWTVVTLWADNLPWRTWSSWTVPSSVAVPDWYCQSSCVTMLSRDARCHLMRTLGAEKPFITFTSIKNGLKWTCLRCKRMNLSFQTH